MDIRGRRIRLTFNLSSISGQEVTSLAEILLQNMNTQRTLKTRQRLHVDVLSQTRQSIYTFTHRANIHHTPSSSQSEALDVSKVIQDVIAAGFTDSLVCITLKLRAGSTNQLPATFSDNIILVVYSEDQSFFNKLQQQRNGEDTTGDEVIVIRGDSTARNKRSTRTRKPKCSKQDLLIDFEQIGWSEWIVYPKQFNAYQCSGKCRDPIALQYEPSNHSIMQSLMRINNKDQVSSLCCVPTSLQPLSMLYYEQGEIVVRHHKDMVVDSCGCR